MQIETYMLPKDSTLTHDKGAGMGTAEVSFNRTIGGDCCYYRYDGKARMPYTDNQLLPLTSRASHATEHN